MEIGDEQNQATVPLKSKLPPSRGTRLSFREAV